MLSLKDRSKEIRGSIPPKKSSYCMLSKTRESLRDSKKRSMIETVIDVAIGFVMYLPINFLILPLFAEQISNYDILGSCNRYRLQCNR